MASKFHIILLAAIRLVLIIAIPDENHHKNVVSHKKKVIQATFIDNYTKNDDICQLFHTIKIIIHHAVVSIVARSTTYINNSLLKSLRKTYSKKKGST